ncbi:MAG: hypothetical protein ABIA04_04590 [Pseudomonadota bacterium]
MKIMAIGFFANSKTHLNALKATEWSDTFHLQPNEVVGGIPGSVTDLKNLKINFREYDAALIFHDSLDPAQRYFNEQCIKNDVVIYANQHGFNKSILQILDNSPNIYSKYWNCMGQYFLNRYKEVIGQDAITRRWISLGSFQHDYLYKNFKWNNTANNGKALIIHEPDLSICEGDPHPHDSERLTEFIIECLKDLGIKADMKPHPNWKHFIGNNGEALDKPEGVNLVDIDVEEIVNYSIVIGSRSSMLLDAVAMSIPTIALESKSTWKDDKYPPVEEGLIPTFSKDKLLDGLKIHFDKKPVYNTNMRNYFLGPLGSVSENYYEFIKNDLTNPAKTLSKHYVQWQGKLKTHMRNPLRSDRIILKSYNKFKISIKSIIKRLIGK